MRRIALSLLLMFAGSAFSSTVGAQERLPKQTDWTWVYTGQLFDAWEALTGKATVTVDGAAFSAKLFDSADPALVRFTLTGTMKGNQIVVRAVREQSDVEPGSYAGRIVTRRFQGFRDDAGVQTIVLFDQSQTQFGFTRSLPRQP